MPIAEIIFLWSKMSKFFDKSIRRGIFKLKHTGTFSASDRSACVWITSSGNHGIYLKVVDDI